MQTDLDLIEKQAVKEIRTAPDLQTLETIRIKYLGRQGQINLLVKQISKLPADKKTDFGRNLNLLKHKLADLITATRPKLEQNITKQPDASACLYALPKYGHFHPISITENEINRLFRSLGFSIYSGPEIETDEFNFRRLNVPLDHPARDLQDSLYIKEPEIVLRTQGSSIETRLLAQEKPPFKAAFPAIVYRNEKVTKSNHFIFHHYQGVAVDTTISLKDLIGTLDKLFKHLYGPRVIVRYRCKYYPEVEPGLGLDLQCFNCHGDGCALCKGAGWIEMGGAGLIHPKVMQMAGINPHRWHGFAFGLGLDRWTMAKYKISDIRTLLGGNLAYVPYLK